MKKILIVGAGGFAREVYGAVFCGPHVNPDWTFAGFLDDRPDALAPFPHYPLGVVGSIRDYQPQQDELLLMGLADPVTKLNLAVSLQERGASFTSYRHHSALVGVGSHLGNGSIMMPFSCLTNDVHVGEFVTINSHSGAGHDAVIGDGCTLSAHCDVTGHVKLGKGVFLGSHASVAPSVTVGDFATIGAGTVAILKVKPHHTIFGVPPQILNKEPKPAALACCWPSEKLA